MKTAVFGKSLLYFSLLVFLGWLFLALFVPQLLSGYDPLATDTGAIFQPPNAAHWLGTDQTGRDIYARIVHGARTTVFTGVLAAFGAALIGGIIGAISAFGPRWERSLAMRIMDAGMSLPEFLLALLIIAYVGTGVVGVTVAVGLAMMPGFAKVAAVSARAAIAREAHFTAKILGISFYRRLTVYVLPRVVRAVAAVTLLSVGSAILMITGLTFLGLGLTPPDPDWGAMLSQAKLFVQRGWWALVFPGLALLATVSCITLLGKQVAARWENGT